MEEEEVKKKKKADKADEASGRDNSGVAMEVASPAAIQPKTNYRGWKAMPFIIGE